MCVWKYKINENEENIENDDRNDKKNNEMIDDECAWKRDVKNWVICERREHVWVCTGGDSEDENEK